MDLAGLATLLTPEGWALLEALPPYDEGAAIRLGEHLRDQGHDPATVAAALTQSRLRQRGEAKFGSFAAGMLFTPDGLEQATRLEVAARHAQRYVSAGIDRVVDLGCGIGSDAMAFASFEREVVGVDQDDLTAAVATVNLRHWPDATVRAGDVTTLDLDQLGLGQPGTGAWLDPSRRTPGRSTASGATRRVTDPEAFSPPWSFVRSLVSRVPATGVKLPPGIAHRHLPGTGGGGDGGTAVEAQWVSVAGEAVECAVWWGPLAREGVVRSALVLGGPDGAAELRELAGERAVRLAGAAAGQVRAGGWLHEPDAAVVAAGLVPRLAAQLQAQGLAKGPTYLVTGSSAASAFARSYLIEDVLPYQLKTLRAYLRDRDVGRLTIKKRGVAIDPDQLRRQLRPTGAAEATIALARVGTQQTVLVLRPA